MIKYDYIIEAQTILVNDWDDHGKDVIEACFNNHVKMSMSEFLENCSTCGGDWCKMFLSGIKVIAPKVWEVIPDHMGRRAFIDICYTLLLLGVDTTTEE